MDYIREFCPAEHRCFVRTNSQGRSAAHLLKLLRIAKRDFKGLDEHRVVLVRVMNDHKNRSYAWEFTPTCAVPACYTIRESIPRLADPVPPIDSTFLLEPALP